MSIVVGIAVSFVGWFLVRYLVAGLYTVNENERAVKTSPAPVSMTPSRNVLRSLALWSG